jgi:hypothetical protein
LVDIFGLLPDGRVLGLKGENLLLLRFEGFFGLFLFLFGFSKVFDKILVVPSDFFGLGFDNVHLSFHLDDFIGGAFSFFVHLSTYFFVVIDLLMILGVHLLEIIVFGGYGIFELFME